METVIVECPRCGKKAEYELGKSPVCPHCGHKIKPIIIYNESVRRDIERVRETERKAARGGNPLLIVVCVGWIIIILFLLSQCGSIFAADGEHCVLCGKDAIYTTPDGQGLCSEHVLDLLSRDEKER